jgi:hypothetical protein
MVPLMPMYNLYVFWIRFAAIINSIKSRNGWRVDPFSEERSRFRQIITKDLSLVMRFVRNIKALVNSD